MQNKLHNRTLFVAALSVYLGLLIVGAPPQVLAQTQKQDVICVNYEEIADIAFAKLQNKPVDFENFVGDLRNVVSDSITQKIELLNVSASIKRTDEIVQSSIKNGDLNAKSIKFFAYANAHLSANFSNYLQNDVSQFHWELQADKLGLISSIGFKQDSAERAQNLGSALQAAQAAFQCKKPHDKYEEQSLVISKNTEVFVQSDQIFIVTRLPRGSLDSLLKADEKAK